MKNNPTKSGSELFIVDNSDEFWKVLQYLSGWCGLSQAIDIASGYFEIGALLALEGEWQKVDKIRILMGDEVSRRTKKAFVEGLQQVERRLDGSLESEKEKNDFLAGVPAIVEALRSGRIQCRVYRKDKFHAKAYVTHARQEVIGAFALVGSSNFTYPGLTENVELNVQIVGRQVNALQEWYEEHWNQAEDVTADILRTIERHTREYSPFEVYAKSLQEFFRGHEMTAGEWETNESKMYGVLDHYQKEGYQALMKLARQYGGAFLCDGVGLGKTFIGLMVIERLVMHERKRVALFVPKSARTDVWEPALRRYLPHLGGVASSDFSNLVLFSHTDIGRTGDFPFRFERIKELADAVVIDEAHHFRNPGVTGLEGKRPSRYRQFYDLIEGHDGTKQVFLLTATPINNKLLDFLHMTELFTREDDKYFKSSLGINSLRGHFQKMERHLKQTMEEGGEDEPMAETNLAEAERVLANDNLFRAVVVQRSRAYVKESQEQQGATTTVFPTREPPNVADYSVEKTYGRLLGKVERAFSKEKPLFALAIYYPYAYYKQSIAPAEKWEENRQKQVVGLIRTQFLKRFESSAYSFESSCIRLLLKLLAWTSRHSETPAEKNRLERWMQQHDELMNHLRQRQRELLGGDDEGYAEEDIITDEMLDDVDYVPRGQYKVEDILADTYLDLDQVSEFLDELRVFKPQQDDKLRSLVNLLKSDPVLRKEKVLVFSEFADTARYLRDRLNEAGIAGVDQIDSGTKRDRSDIIRRFSPYYNESCSSKLAEAGTEEIRVLVSTDVLSEGLNLQDATRLINYDLHWNPVRLMQRIGRVDRRLNPEVEERIVADHPEQKELRAKVVFWNFLPPRDLEVLLRLYNRVAHKTLRISKTFGIEGKKLLKPEDDYDALKNFNHTYEGTPSFVESLRLEYNELLKRHPDLAARLNALPGRVFSGKQHPSKDSKAVFFCYRLPRPDQTRKSSEGEPEWTEEAGETKWLLYDLADGKVVEEAADIVDVIRSELDAPRHCVIERETLSEIRLKVEKHIKNTYLKRMQAPVGVKPKLKAWMELS
jgi:superfamily II DNA or RNA helicase